MEMVRSCGGVAAEVSSASQTEDNREYQPEPAIGKSMSVTSLVLSFPPPTTFLKNYASLSRDGLSPDYDKPSMFFPVRNCAGPLDSFMRNSLKTTDPIREPFRSNYQEKPDQGSNVESTVGADTVAYNRDDEVESAVEESSKLIPTMCPRLKSRDPSPVPVSELCSKVCDASVCPESSEKDLEDIISPEKYVPSTKAEAVVSKAEAVVSKADQKRKEFLNGLINAAGSDLDDSDGLRAEEFTIKDFREKFALAEALAKTSMMTSPAAKRRLAARKIEMQLDNGEYTDPATDEDNSDYIPPRQLLLYLVRMGSFNSAPKINNPDAQDNSVEVPQGLSTTGLVQYCKMMRGENRPELLSRYFLKPVSNKAVISTDITDGLRVLKLSAVSKICSAPVTSPNQIRVFQWNILSQCLGQNNDGFVKCPDEALTWENRKYLIVEEIVRNNPDVICLQEVDHFKFLERMLGSQNYSGIFFPKPDSPCLYIQDNNGPDGCAIFYKRDKFDVVKFETRILEVWRVQSNQVAIVMNLRIIGTGKEICVCTTHLKARNGALLSKLRNEQGKDLLRFANAVAQGRPVIMCGDFNAEPIEPIYSTVLNYRPLGLSSAYSDINENANKEQEKICNGNAIENDHDDNDSDGESGQLLTPAEISASREPAYTTWKIREEGEVCHTIDYVFYSKKYLKVNNCLQFPKEQEIGINRTPSFQYPSDHFALLCDFEIIDDPKDLIL